MGATRAKWEMLEQVLVTVFVLRLFNMERIRTINVGLPTYVDLHKVRRLRWHVWEREARPSPPLAL